MRVDVFFHAQREGVDVRLVGLLVVAYDVAVGSGLVSAHLVESRGDLGAVKERRLADIFPRFFGCRLDPRLECVQQSLSIEVVFHFGDMLLVAVEVAAMAVEYLDESGKETSRLGAALVGRDDVDVEEDRLARMAGAGHFHGAPQRGVVLKLGQDVVDGPFASDLLVLQDHGEDLQQVRLAAAEEARDPRSVAGGVGVVVLVEEAAEMPREFGGDDVLVKLVGEVLDAGGLHDRVDWPVDWLFVHVLVSHGIAS